MRALGLDVGQKTIGVALTDEAEIAAHPLEVIARAGTNEDVARVAQLVATHAITDIVIGMPYELSGRIGHRGKRVQVFVDALRAAVSTPAYHEEDERFTTAEAQRMLIDGDVSRAGRKQVIDRVAASLILQTWLDRRKAK